MAEKLSESAWTGFLKKQKLEFDDKALVKALSAYDKTDDSKPEPRLKSLEEVIKQVPEQVKALIKRKKELGDKPFGLVKDKLYELLDEAEGLLKKTQAAIAAAEGDDDEEPDTPVLLTTKMVPLLRELRKGEVRMHAMICTAGKNTAVLIMRRAISASRRKLLAEAVDAKGGMKYIVGECVFENKALTFVVQSPATQLAKRLRQALLDQTEMRIKVRVRGEDGVEDEDLEGEDGDDEKGEVETAKGASTADAPMAQGTSKAPPMDPAFKFRSRLTGMVPRMKPVEAAGGSTAAQVKAKREEAVALVRQKGFGAADLERALALLDDIEALIGASGIDVTSSGPKAAAATGTKVIFQQTRLAWDATRKTIQAEVKKLEDSILASCKADEDVGSDGVDLTRLSGILEKLDSRLIDKLDEALNAQDPAERQRLHSGAKEIVAEYMAFVNESPLMADIDDSGFAPVAVRKTALSALTLLSSKL